MPAVTKAPSQRSSVMAASQPLAGGDVERRQNEEGEPRADIDEIEHDRSPCMRSRTLNFQAYKFESGCGPGAYRFHIGWQPSNRAEHDYSRRVDWRQTALPSLGPILAGRTRLAVGIFTVGRALTAIAFALE